MLYIHVTDTPSAVYSFVGSYYSDDAWLCASVFPLFGGSYYESSGSAGLFCLLVYNGPSAVYTSVGSLSFKLSGNITTYYSDWSWFSANCFPGIGGHWLRENLAGVFLIWVDYGASGAGSHVGSICLKYSDRSVLNANCIVLLGGTWADGSWNGLFCLQIDNGTSGIWGWVGSKIQKQPVLSDCKHTTVTNRGLVLPFF